MTTARDSTTARRVQGQGRILEALAADGAVLTGTLEHLGAVFELPPRVVRICLLDLTYAGWIIIDRQPSGHLTIRLDHHIREGHPVPLRLLR